MEKEGMHNQSYPIAGLSFKNEKEKLSQNWKGNKRERKGGGEIRTSAVVKTL